MHVYTHIENMQHVVNSGHPQLQDSWGKGGMVAITGDSFKFCIFLCHLNAYNRYVLYL